jgi:hypothetical protein
MTVRRLLGLLTLFVMFHLTLVGPDDVCAEHGQGAKESRTHGQDGHQMAMAGVEQAASNVSHNTCETPRSPHCCEAVTSCAVSLAVVERSAAPAISIGRDGIPATPVGALLSRSLAPEPPPPKA